MDQIAWPDRVADRRIGWIRVPVRVRHGIEVVQVPKELIEAVHAWKVFVQVAEVVFAELTSRITHGLERRGNRRRLRRHADISARLTDRCHSGADRKFACDEVRASGRAACFRIVVGESHSFRRQPVKVRRFTGHNALMVRADIEPTNVVTHDEKDIRSLLLRGLSAGRVDRSDRQQRDGT